MKNIRGTHPLYKELATEKTVSLKTYADITGRFNKFLISIALEGHQVTLPSKLGTFKILGTKQKIKVNEFGTIKGTSPDWQKTKALWERNPEAKANKTLVYHTNSHSGGMRYKYLWAKKRVLVTNKRLYSLTMSRANKRELAKRVKEGKEY